MVTVLGRVISSILYTLALLLVARFAGPDKFGPLSGMLGAGLFLGAVGDLGMTTFILRQRSLDRHSEEVSTALVISRWAVLVVAFIVATIGIVLGLPPALAVLTALGLSLDKYSDAWQAILIADNRNSLASGLLMGRRTLLFGSVVWGSLTLSDSLIGFAVGIFTAGAISQAFHLLATHDLRLPRKHDYSSLLAQTRAYWTSVMSSQARELDVTSVLLFAGPGAAGLYAAGSRLARPVLLVAGALANVVLPHFSRTGSFQARRATHVIAVAAGCLVVVGVFTAPVVPLLIKTLLGSGYEDAEPIAIAFLISIGPIALSSIMGSILQANGYERFVAINGSIFALLALSATGLGAHFGGALPAAIAMGAALSVKFVALWVGSLMRFPRA
ncbi:lipopolysaccharide biosynthesis protein [Leucobacter sp. USHLN154]|uniref:lipopolysaccharide biosynthesis protein n=1 Tax=Leucobacter sp. USHLN154 TaxID=3081269 RepID=UPI003016F48A